MGEKNTPTALKGCGVKTYKLNIFQVTSELLIDKMSVDQGDKIMYK